MSRSAKQVIKTLTPAPVRRWARSRWKRSPVPPPVGAVDFGDLRRLTPISHRFGADRGTIVDRYYIDAFLRQYNDDIRDRVLEVGDNRYILEFGGDKVAKGDVLHVEDGNPLATIVADLTHADDIPSNTFQCIIFIHTIQMIYDLHAAMGHLHRILKPGGVLLLATHGTSRVGRRLAKDNWCVYWRMTEDSLQRLMSETFSPENVTIHAYGNILTAIAFLHGLAAEELTQEELDRYDPDYQVLIAARGVKSLPAG